MDHGTQKADFIKDDVIFAALEKGKRAGAEDVKKIIEKGRMSKGLEVEEVAALLQINDPSLEEKLFDGFLVKSGQSKFSHSPVPELSFLRAPYRG